MHSTSLVTAGLLAIAASSTTAALAEEHVVPLDTCVDLGSDRDIARHGPSSSLTLRDGQRYYLMTLRGTCHSMNSARVVSVRAQGVDGRICPEGTRVQTQHDICVVKKIEQTDAPGRSAFERR